ncbi:MAG: glycine zipper 2TM domain-containing protein [Pseudomonadota bacterium]
MNTSNDLQPGQQPTSSNAKPLWAAVGILGAAVLAMGGTMIYQQRAPAPLISAPAPVALVAAPPVVAVAPATAADDLIEKPVAAPVVKPAPQPVKKVVQPTPKPVPQPAPVLSYSPVAPAPAPYPAPMPVAQVCRVCGSVESVTPVQRSTKAAGPGVGAVAGGVLGAVLGNQVGHGGGRTAATILGAVGGGFAGNAIENNVRKVTVYEVGVRMEDGSHRVVEVAQAPGVGARVTVEGSSLRTGDGNVYRAHAPAAAPAVQQQPIYHGQ